MPSPSNRPPSFIYRTVSASLSLRERAGVRERSLAGERKEKTFSPMRTVSAHPNPLPMGEGTVRFLLQHCFGRIRLTSLLAFCPLLLALAALPFIAHARGSSPRVSKGVTSYALPNSRATAPIDARAERSDQPSSDSSFIIHRSSLSWLSNWSAFDSSPFALRSARTLSPLVAFATAYTWNQTGTASYTTSTNWT